MKLKIKLLTALLISSVFLTGCYPTGEKKNPTNPISDTAQSVDGENTFYADGIVNEQLDNVTFGFEISADFPAQLNKIKLKPKTVDTETVKNAFLHDKTIIEELHDGRDIYKTSDKCKLAIFPDSFTFTDDSATEALKRYDEIAAVHNQICNASGEELKSFSSKEAIEHVNEILDTTGVEDYAEPYVIPISPEMANSFLKAHGGSPDEYSLWDDDDGMYILIYPLKFNGINIPTADLKATARMAYGAKITAYVTKDCVFNIKIRTLYELESANEGTADLTFSAVSATNELINRYSKIIINDQRSFTECRLEYIPLEWDDGGIIFTPAWCFMGYKADEGFPLRWDIAEYYYAETGIRYGGY